MQEGGIMNDFTKYELQSILWAIDYVRERTNNCGDTMRSLQGKLREIINNYCDHEWENFCCGCDPENLICKKCNKDLWSK